MKKIIKILTVSLLFGAVAFGVKTAVNKQDAVRTEASSLTKWVWMKNSITADWDKDGAATAIHYWGGATGTAWPGVLVKWDQNNEKCYYDLPNDVTHYMFIRVSGDGTQDWGAKTADLTYTDSVGKYFDLTGPIVWGGGTTPGSFVAFPAGQPYTTVVVNNFHLSINTAAGACSATKAQAAINTFNDNLTTFEQNQYKAMDVGGGKTGLDRLNYLKARYGITTPLAGSPVRITDDEKTAMFAILTISGLGILSLGGYFFLKKKQFN
ncbi:MAG: hypothetical protein BWY30_00789 [Tenericutes bacterium ADurb.Bin239]|nr:MAG: hypothetical protein BWY30_00789 [Tenericutes bacterium ADurb.Bin239]